MRSLVDEATRKADSKEGAGPGGGKLTPAHLAKLLHPMALVLEALVRASAENAQSLGRLGEQVSAQDGLGEKIEALRQGVESRNGANRAMFDALYEELKGYKEGFLIESLQRPVIRDLIVLFDDIALVSDQMKALLAGGTEAERPDLERVAQNLTHAVDAVVEVLSRLGVERMPPGSDKLDRERQKAVALEPARSKEDDGVVVRVVRPGFTWRGRIFRPEEVVVRKYRDGLRGAGHHGVAGDRKAMGGQQHTA